jgi:hypothetical protein
MDKEGFYNFLQTRNLSDEQVEQQVAAVERFEAFLQAMQPPNQLEGASAEAARAFVDRLIAEGNNTENNLLALARYGRFIKNHILYVAILELLDGAEVLEGMYRKVGQVLGEQMRHAIFGEIALPPLGIPNQEKARITQVVMERLENQVDNETYRQIFSDSFRDLGDAGYLPDKTLYEEIGDFDRFLEVKRQQFIALLERIKNEGGLYFTQEITDEVIDFVRNNPEISEGVRQGDILYVTKIPYMAREFLAETDPEKKRYLYCHCPWARQSLRQGERPVSARFCQCSAGYHKKGWEVIFGHPLQADVLESVLQGDMRCRFAIRLPPEALSNH